MIGMVSLRSEFSLALCLGWVGFQKKFFHDFMIGIEMEFFGLAGDVEVHVEAIVDSWVFLASGQYLVDAAPASCTFAIVF